jgi:hypothetical protein
MTEQSVSDDTDSTLEDLLAFIRDARSFDFTGYKRSSLARRIRKRMHEAGAANYVDYRDRLETVERSAMSRRSLAVTCAYLLTIAAFDQPMTSITARSLTPGRSCGRCALACRARARR